HGSAVTDRVAAMSATLVHRGPDSFGEFSDGDVALAARRLSIIDLETGDQPIANEDGTLHVVQNGEIYNYRELRRELERAGHRYRTHGDTEVLLHLYEQHGNAFASRLRGMFALATWDARKRRSVLARDRFGIKPLYYPHADGGLAFATPCVPTSSATFPSVCSCPEASTRHSLLRWRPRRARSSCARSRSGSKSGRSTSSKAPGRSPGATRLVTASSSCVRTRRGC